MKNRPLKTECRLTREEKEFILNYCDIKDRTESGLIRYALKRLFTTNPVKGLKLPESFRTEKTDK